MSKKRKKSSAFSSPPFLIFLRYKLKNAQKEMEFTARLFLSSVRFRKKKTRIYERLSAFSPSYVCHIRVNADNTPSFRHLTPARDRERAHTRLPMALLSFFFLEI